MSMDTKKYQTMNTKSLNMLKGIIEPGATINIPTANPTPTIPVKPNSNTVWYIILGIILLVILFVLLYERNKQEDSVSTN